MTDTAKIEAKLAGGENARARRAELLAELGRAFAQGGPQTVTDTMNRRAESLAEAFEEQLEGLRRQL